MFVIFIVRIITEKPFWGMIIKYVCMWWGGGEGDGDYGGDCGGDGGGDGDGGGGAG